VIALKGVGRKVKEKKYEWKIGAKARLKMLTQIASINLILRIH